MTFFGFDDEEIPDSWFIRPSRLLWGVCGICRDTQGVWTAVYGDDSTSGLICMADPRHGPDVPPRFVLWEMSRMAGVET